MIARINCAVKTRQQSPVEVTWNVRRNGLKERKTLLCERGAWARIEQLERTAAPESSLTFDLLPTGK